MIRIYAMTHRDFVPPPDPMYVPLHVGRAAHHVSAGDPILRFRGDDTGDSISGKNPFFSELTGLYWVWKNDRESSAVGSCHYRRYLISDETGTLLTGEEIRELLDSCDLITTKNLQLNFPYEYGFNTHHKPEYLIETGRVMEELYPRDFPVFQRLIREPHTYFGNMLIAKRWVYDSYMEWLFSILFTLEQRITVEEEDSYHRRIYGFISEFLLYVYVVSRGLHPKECKVGMTAEKSEVTAVKKRLAEYFEKGDYVGAREYFLEQKRLRPDITMEASDITGELHLAMQVIATAGLEEKTYGRHILQRIHSFPELMGYFSTLNHYAAASLTGAPLPEGEGWMKANGVSAVAREVAKQVVSGAGSMKKAEAVAGAGTMKKAKAVSGAGSMKKAEAVSGSPSGERV